MVETWQGQKVVIVGAARQGLALARYLLRHGAQVVLTDQRSPEALADARQSLIDLESAGLPLEWVCGGHPFSLLDGAGWLCPSGGVPLTLPLVQEAQRRGILLTNDSQVFLETAPCRVVGITGSAGKTTTTTLVGRMAGFASQAAGQLPSPAYRRAWVGGNIGSPLIAEVDSMRPDDLAIMELSSFQLEIMTRSPQVGAILNITPNHLDRHGTMAAYAAAKANILTHQAPADRAVLGRDDPGAWEQAGNVPGQLYSFGFSPLPAGQPGGYLLGNPREAQATLMLRTPDGAEIAVMRRGEISLPGNHMVANVLAACTIAAAADLPVEAMRAGVQGFRGVAHRLEFIRMWGGASWYNGSIATAPERVIADIHAFEAEPLVLLVGGRDKKLPWDELATLVQQRVDHLIVFGEAAEIVLQALDRTRPAAGAAQRLQSVTRCEGLRQAVQMAAQVVEPGDVVLLSPGGTSFDEFKDFEERGVCFAQWVNELV